MTGFRRIAVSGQDGLGTYEELDVDGNVFPLGVILKTAYWYTDKAYLQIRLNTESEHYFVTFRSKNENENLSPELVGDFCNSLIDQAVRLQVQNETQEIQTIIVKRAFAEGLNYSERKLSDRLG